MTSGKKMAGFTLLELLIVMGILALLAGLIAPSVVRSIRDAKETALRENLRILRKVIDDHLVDQGQYPISAEDIGNYLRGGIPQDPFTEKKDWQFLRKQIEDNEFIIDVKSNSEDLDAQGIPYSQW